MSDDDRAERLGRILDASMYGEWESANEGERRMMAAAALAVAEAVAAEYAPLVSAARKFVTTASILRVGDVSPLQTALAAVEGGGGDGE